MGVLRGILKSVKIMSVLKAPLWPFRKLSSIRSARSERKTVKREAKEELRFSRMSGRLQTEVSRTRSRLTD